MASTTINRSVFVSGRRYSADNTETHVVNVDQGVLGPGDVGDVHVVGGGGDILQLLTGEDLSFPHHTNHLDQLSMLFPISLVLALALAGHPGRMLLSADERRNETHVDGDQVNLGVTVLSGLGGGHLFSPTHPSCSHHIRTEPNPGQYVVVGQYRYGFVVGIDFMSFEFVVSVVRS